MSFRISLRSLIGIYTLALLTSLSAAAFDTSFSPGVFYATSPLPGSVRSGDLNNDGNLDLIVLSLRRITVLMGNGDGTFVRGVTFKTGDSSANAVALGDFNGDGNLDLIVTSELKPEMFYAGKGDGTFQPGVVSSRTKYGLGAVIAADFNQDGKLDLAGESFDFRHVAILLGNGDGTFGNPTLLRSSNPLSLAAGDLDGNGTLDVIEAIGPGAVGVLLGNGDGSFQPVVTYQVKGVECDSVTIADFNGDGIPDVAAAVISGMGDGVAAVLIGNGDGTLQFPAYYNSGRESIAIAAADLDGNATSDLVVANEFANTISVFFGTGDGTFPPPVTYDAGRLPSDLALADFNHDGAPDIAVSAFNSGGVTIFLNKGAPR